MTDRDFTAAVRALREMATSAANNGEQHCAYWFNEAARYLEFLAPETEEQRVDPVQRALDGYHAGNIAGGRAVITEAEVTGVLGPGEVAIRVKFEVRHDGGGIAAK